MHPSENRRILIIDDNPSIQDDFRKILGDGGGHHDSLSQKEAILFGKTTASATRSPGFEIESAYQGEQAVEMIVKAGQQSRPYAVAFVDVRMPPGWDGIETIERILPVDSGIQLVICSAYSDYSASDIASRLGVSDRLLMLRKPCDPAEILLIATTLCEKWNLAQFMAASLDAAV